MEDGLRTAFAQLDGEIMQRLKVSETPGLSLAITDRERTLKVGTYGMRDLAAGEPVTPETMFEIGSIGKSFTALMLLRLRERGLVDLTAPVTDYLPWFSVRSSHEPITVSHLLSHTAGIIGGTDMAYDGRYESWALRETEVSGAPGKHFHYSNVGYKTLGYLIEDVSGRPYGDVVRERILAPLGMNATVVPITNADRPRMAVGYRRLHDDRPAFPGQPMVPTTWIETATADGGLASTPEDMARYLRMLLAGGMGPWGPIVSEESYAALTAPAYTGIWGREDSWYGLGLSGLVDDGQRLIGHGGGMVGYHSFLAYDPEAGLGVIAMVNGPEGDPMGVALRALRLTRAGLAGTRLEPEAPPPSPFEIPGAEEFLGTYYRPNMDIEVRAFDGGLIVVVDGAHLPVLRYGDGRFLVRHPRFALFPLVAMRNDGNDVIGLNHGPDWYARDGMDEPPVPEFPTVWETLPGHYRCHNPWASNCRVVLRRGKLLLVRPEGDEDALTALGDGSFRIGADESPERVRFGAVLDGKALMLNLSGQGFYRSPLS